MSQESLEPTEQDQAPPAADAAPSAALGQEDLAEPVAAEPVAAEPVAAEPEADDPVEEFKTLLRRQPGDWFVIHSYAGYENRVKANLENRIQSLNMEDFIFQVEVPMEEVIEIKNAQRKVVRRVRIPGYVLVRMDLTDESWGCIRHTPAVTGFVGNANDPTPLMLDEVASMLRPGIVAKVAASAQGKGKRPTKKIEVQDYQIGDAIMVIEGPFAGVPGTITEINPNSQRLIATVEFMGRDTPVDLTFPQIQKS